MFKAGYLFADDSSRARRLATPSLLIVLMMFSLGCGNQDRAEPEAAAGSESARKTVRIAGLDADLHHGVDVSHYSGNVVWRQVAAEGMAFAFAKATEGNNFKDPRFDGHLEGIVEAGLIPGAYHFYDPGVDPREQAQWFIDNVDLPPGSLPPVLDIESAKDVSADTLAEDITIWLETVEAHFGATPIINTPPNFWDKHLGNRAHFSRFHLWVAEYDVDQPRIPDPWENFAFWQFAGNDRLSGIDNDVDLSVFNGERADLLKILTRQPNEPDPAR